MLSYSKPTVIAEIGCNHKGDFKIAIEMIKQAALCGANVCKFQKRDNVYFLGNKYKEPHPNPVNSYGETYGAHREFLELNIEQHFSLYEECNKHNVQYSTSVWEKKSAEEIFNSKINMNFIKVPSACNLDFELLDFLTKNFKNKIHISTGMTTEKEIEEIIDFLIKKNRNKDIVLYACTSDYPCEFDDISLLEISRLHKKYSDIVSNIGFSGHHLGIAVDIAAFTLGATFIERHFTLDRTWKGTDHAASLESQGLQKLCRDLNNTFKSLNFKQDKFSNNEIFQRKKLKKIKNI